MRDFFRNLWEHFPLEPKQEVKERDLVQEAKAKREYVEKAVNKLFLDYTKQDTTLQFAPVTLEQIRATMTDAEKEEFKKIPLEEGDRLQRLAFAVARRLQEEQWSEDIQQAA